ncbi:MAG: hypothetical protein J1E78_05015 [Muribaculaceae bacterium]|nr:hypothetical protein [Muribaculaceae bacterium]
MNLKNKYINLLAIPALMLACACATNTEPEEQPTTESAEEFVDLTFNVRPETSELNSRAGEVNNGAESHIGKGEKLDMLIYAVYVKNNNGDFVLDSNYAGSVSDYSDNRLTKAGYTSASHPGQYIIPADFNSSSYMTIEIPKMRVGETYRVAFWSQSSEAAKAYDTSDLDKVEVKYTDDAGNDFANNDETRDAFCQVWEATVTADMSSEDVILYRPLSQINVGTTGANYRDAMEGEARFPLMKVTHSQITISGVARFLSVVDDRIRVEDGTTDVTFDWAPLPAYINMDKIPTDNNGLVESDDEEFLRVDLNKDNKFEDYLVNYPTRGKDGSFLTETFKYLSMCYVLIPTGTSGSSVLDKIEVGFAEDGKGLNGMTTISLTSTPVSRNYRTNILCGFSNLEPTTPDDPATPETPSDPENPDTPDNPDDPNIPDDPEPEEPVEPEIPSDFLNAMRIYFMLDNNFDGRVDHIKQPDSTWQSNWFPTTSGN